MHICQVLLFLLTHKRICGNDFNCAINDKFLVIVQLFISILECAFLLKYHWVSLQT